MKKVGTITASLGLIFLGTWMIISREQEEVGKQLFKWWPVLLIILGVEILIYFSRKKEDTRIKLNYIVIPVLLVFLFINIFQGLHDIFPKNISKGFDYNKFLFNGNKSISFNNEYLINSKDIKIKISNGDIRVKKSSSDKIKIQGKIYVDKHYKQDKIDGQKVLDLNSFNFNEDFINGVKLEIFLPDNIYLNVDGDNIKFKKERSLKGNYFIKGENGDISFEGDAEIITVKLNNGKVDVNNKLGKNLDISLDNGIVNVNMDNRNITANLELNVGVAIFNKDKRVNAGIIKTIGDGSSKIKIKVDNGTIRLNSQE